MQKGRLSEDEARFYTAEVIDALEYIHGLGLIHRDIKVFLLLLSLNCFVDQEKEQAKNFVNCSPRTCYLLLMDT